MVISGGKLVLHFFFSNGRPRQQFLVFLVLVGTKDTQYPAFCGRNSPEALCSVCFVECLSPNSQKFTSNRKKRNQIQRNRLYIAVKKVFTANYGSTAAARCPKLSSVDAPNGAIIYQSIRPASLPAQSRIYNRNRWCAEWSSSSSGGHREVFDPKAESCAATRCPKLLAAGKGVSLDKVLL